MEGMLESGTEKTRGFGDAVTPDEDQEQATPDEQMDYDLLTIRARKMMFGKGKDKILTLLGSSEAPAKGIGKAGSMLMKSLIQSSKQQGRNISPEAAVNAGASIAEDLNDLAKANGVFQYDSPEEEEKELADGVLWGIKLFGDGMIQDGELTPEISELAKTQVQDGIAEEEAQGGGIPQKTKVSDAVSKGMNPAPAGLVAGEMGRVVE
jgi:hypothetical protein